MSGINLGGSSSGSSSSTVTNVDLTPITNAINGLKDSLHKDSIEQHAENKVDFAKLRDSVAELEKHTESLLTSNNKQLEQLTIANKIEVIKIYLEQLDRIYDAAKSDSYSDFSDETTVRLKSLERRVNERKAFFFSELRRLTGYSLWTE